MMIAMAAACEDCGGETTYVRSRYEARFPETRLVMEEVPSVRCEACDRNSPAPHVRAQFDAVVALAEDVTGATMHKDFSTVPLEPDARP